MSARFFENGPMGWRMYGGPWLPWQLLSVLLRGNRVAHASVHDFCSAEERGVSEETLKKFAGAIYEHHAMDCAMRRAIGDALLEVLSEMGEPIDERLEKCNG